MYLLALSTSAVLRGHSLCAIVHANCDGRCHGVLANLAITSFAHLVQVTRHGLKKIQYQPGLISQKLSH